MKILAKVDLPYNERYIVEIEAGELRDLMGVRTLPRMAPGDIIAVKEGLSDLQRLRSDVQTRNQMAGQLRAMASILEAVPDPFKSATTEGEEGA